MAAFDDLERVRELNVARFMARSHVCAPKRGQPADAGKRKELGRGVLDTQFRRPARAGSRLAVAEGLHQVAESECVEDTRTEQVNVLGRDVMDMGVPTGKITIASCARRPRERHQVNALVTRVGVAGSEAILVADVMVDADVVLVDGFTSRPRVSKVIGGARLVRLRVGNGQYVLRDAVDP